MMGSQTGWCRHHPYDCRHAAAGGGVCPYCLHQRLYLLCPECAQVRPCPCYTSPSLSPSSTAGSSSGSSSSSDLAASWRQRSASVGGRGRLPPARKVEGEKGNVPRSSSVRVSGNVLSGGGKGGGLKWLNRVFSMVARAFGGQGKAAKVGKEQPDALCR